MQTKAIQRCIEHTDYFTPIKEKTNKWKWMESKKLKKKLQQISL